MKNEKNFSTLTENTYFVIGLLYNGSSVHIMRKMNRIFYWWGKVSIGTQNGNILVINECMVKQEGSHAVE